MTSKSPDPHGRGSDLAESDPHGSDSVRSGAASSKLETLREAISEIDQRHAEGENGFFADDTSDAPTAATGAASGSVQTSESEEISSFANALSFDDDDGDGPEDFDAAYKKAKKTAMNMLAMRDHASGELRDKLLKRDFLPAAVDELIAKLQKSRLLNDEEFAHRYVRAHRERRKLSRSALKRELNKKGLPAEIVSDAVEDVDGEDDLARQVAEKKAASTRGLDHDVRERRILGMLARRGFASSVCLKVTREVLAED
ncbi:MULTISPECIES: regulatory protein RecX [Brevibacterium]|uniref:Regulatory protein RecX n=2 Tax=Brevibacterium aurantiacum TaxID=273384 RepID=A0A2A3ZSX6_BREAU|nr:MULTISPECIES: regulatory protein RecX [Brevibacterium]MDN5594579.1 recombination regulator RecX [Brevibacterium sp.]AZL06279.1 regulatory protein RecX [Brevibacterium aurantiacum]AZL09836.1 regulatory protein RecX [Brevibacterium aurantiacum]AZL13486.1 regulatory protein RecX [Brevibacterium aurantiacum]AZT97799.1 regulatory protein RecX [Brevibacterium aurantiacum]